MALDMTTQLRKVFKLQRCSLRCYNSKKSLYSLITDVTKSSKNLMNFKEHLVNLLRRLKRNEIKQIKARSRMKTLSEENSEK